MKSIILIIFMLFMSNSNAESRIKVAVIDTGISFNQSIANYSCKGQHKTLVGGSIYDYHGHGTNIIGIISKSIDPKTHCIVSYKFFNANTTSDESVQAVRDALLDIKSDLTIRYLNMSLGGPLFDITERSLLQSLLIRGVKVTVAAGNERNNLNIKCNYFPACYSESKYFKFNNFFVVKSKHSSTNFGRVVTDTFSGTMVGTPAMTGTSQASAQKMAKILKDVVLYNNRRADDRLQPTSDRRTQYFR